MATYIALSRAVNVGGHGMISMADLRDCVAKLGFTNVQTLLQSGNLVFRSDKRAARDLELLLEKELDARHSLQTHFMVRTAAEWDRIIERNPFPAEAKRDPARLVLMALKEDPASKDVEALR